MPFRWNEHDLDDWLVGSRTARVRILCASVEAATSLRAALYHRRLQTPAQVRILRDRTCVILEPSRTYVVRAQIEEVNKEEEATNDALLRTGEEETGR